MNISTKSLYSLFAIAALFSACKDLKPTGTGGSATPGGPQVKMEMYVMSKCPFGVQAEDGIKPVLDEIGGSVDFKIDYIASESNGQFNSLHGEPEVKGNIIQLCAIKHYPDRAKWMSLISCQNKNWRQIPDGWESCAKSSGLDAGTLKSCIDGEEGKTLLRESAARSQAAQAQGSPTIVIGGERYNGGRSQRDFMRAICGKMSGSKPEACAKIPEPVSVSAVVITDKRCAQCDTRGVESSLRGRFFPKLTVRTLDYGTDEGKAMYKEIGEKYLPVLLFEAGVEKAEGYDQISRWMIPKGKYRQLRYPAKFDPTAEICDNKIDDTGDTKIDCDDVTCKDSLTCREEKKNQLDVFIMSECPFGVKAVNSMKEVMTNFKGQINFDVHYIADKTPEGFQALHGQTEVDENIRQLCVKKYYRKANKYLNYMWCRNTAYEARSSNPEPWSDWKKCATGGISASVIEKCATGDDGKKLLEEDIKVAKALEISGSPTWLANNRYKFSGIAPDAIKGNVCRYNANLPNCDKQLTGDTPPSAGGQPAGGSCN